MTSKGFTMIELIFIIVILGILSTVFFEVPKVERPTYTETNSTQQTTTKWD